MRVIEIDRGLTYALSRNLRLAASSAHHHIDESHHHQFSSSLKSSHHHNHHATASSSSSTTTMSKRRSTKPSRRVALPKRSDTDACIDPNPANTLTDRMNTAFNSSGPNYVLSLCAGELYYIQSPIIMFDNGQEISTEGYPIEQEDGTDERATLVVSGPVSLGEGHTTAIDGMCRKLCLRF